MKNSFTDFGDLKNLRKQLDKEEKEIKQSNSSLVKPRSPKPPVQEKNKCPMPGIMKGTRVRMMDTSDTGTVVGKGKGFYEIELDGLVIRASKGEFIPIDESLDRKMIDSVPSSSKRINKKDTFKASTTSDIGDLTIDLHFNRIPGHERVPEWAALEYQMEYFNKVLRENLRHRGRRLIFIHGDGEGILKDAVRRELDNRYSVFCTYTFGGSEHYGTGATVVTIK